MQNWNAVNNKERKMDEDFEYFYKDSGFGPSIACRKVDPDYAEKFRGKLPY